MSLKSSAIRYGAVSIAMHWVTAAALFGLVGTGLTMADMIDEPGRLPLMRAHVVTGVAVVALTLLRMAWWAFADRGPTEAVSQPLWRARAARTVHVLFYVVILALGASGIATIILSGAGTVLFADAVQALPDLDQYSPRTAHGVFAWTMIALIVIHIAAALYHQFVANDRLLGRMGLGPAG